MSNIYMHAPNYHSAAVAASPSPAKGNWRGKKPPTYRKWTDDSPYLFQTSKTDLSADSEHTKILLGVSRRASEIALNGPEMDTKEEEEAGKKTHSFTCIFRVCFLPPPPLCGRKKLSCAFTHVLNLLFFLLLLLVTVMPLESSPPPAG